MVADDRPKVRKEAVCKIEDTGSRCSVSGVVREFRVPNIHFQAKDYEEFGVLGTSASLAMCAPHCPIMSVQNFR